MSSYCRVEFITLIITLQKVNFVVFYITVFLFAQILAVFFVFFFVIIIYFSHCFCYYCYFYSPSINIIIIFIIVIIIIVIIITLVVFGIIITIIYLFISNIKTVYKTLSHTKEEFRTDLTYHSTTRLFLRALSF